MKNGIFISNCRGCKLSQGIEEKPGGIIELSGNWILNQYGGKEGFLGWMALQPKFHRMEFAELNKNEISTLARNIQKIEIALRNYWGIRFREDPIERVYIGYFFEGVFDEPASPEEKELWHLHIHIIVRTKDMEKLLRQDKYKSIKNIKSTNAWMIYDVSNPSIPCDHHDPNLLDELKYWPTYKERDKNEVEKLMTFLRIFIGSFFPLEN